MSASARSNIIDIIVEYRRETALAILVHDGAHTVWLAKSQIEIEIDKPKLGMAEIALPEWLAKEKGLI